MTNIFTIMRGWLDDDDDDSLLALLESKRTKYEIYKDKRNEWRWRFVVDHDILAISSDSYTNRQQCMSSITAINDTRAVKVLDA